MSNALGLAARTRLIEERKLIIQHPRAWRSGGVRNRLPRWPSALLQIEKFLYPSRMVADIRIIPTSAVSGRIVSFSPVDRQTGETKAKVRESIGGKFVSVNIVSIAVVRQGNEQKEEERRLVEKSPYPGRGSCRVVVEEREGR